MYVASLLRLQGVSGLSLHILSRTPSGASQRFIAIAPIRYASCSSVPVPFLLSYTGIKAACGPTTYHNYHQRVRVLQKKVELCMPRAQSCHAITCHDRIFPRTSGVASLCSSVLDSGEPPGPSDDSRLTQLDIDFRMSDSDTDLFLVALIIVIIVILSPFFCLAWCIWSLCQGAFNDVDERGVEHHRSHRGPPLEYTHYIPSNTSFTNPYNNHDHEKHPHATREDAEAEVLRMKRLGYEGSARLQIYYNRQLRAWFVGRSSR